MAAEDEVIFEVKNSVGIITLNRPEALNSLSWNMVQLIDAKLKAWAEDSSIKAVIIEGSGGRAFCSGGDVKSVALAGKDSEMPKEFFRDEYTMNNRIFNFPKPYVSLIDGIVMGGGKGISAHGSHRIVTENVLFAMPETSIGFFPDVGGGYFLPRCTGKTGVYLALTSKRIKSADCLYIGFATHFVKSDKLGALREEMISGPEKIDEIINSFSTTPDEKPELQQNIDKINSSFSHAKIEDIVSDLENDKSEWAIETLKSLKSVSPTSLKIALKQIILGAKMSFTDVMVMEYRISQKCLQGHDFYEGVRAAIIDKDRNLKWNPAEISDVLDSDIDRYFEPLGADELVLED